MDKEEGESVVKEKLGRKISNQIAKPRQIVAFSPPQVSFILLPFSSYSISSVSVIVFCRIIDTIKPHFLILEFAFTITSISFS